MTSYSSSAATNLSAIPVLQLEDFDVLKMIGKGHSARVFLAIDRASSRQVAIKVIPKGAGHDTWAVKEQAIHRRLDGCSFLLPLLASWHDDANFYLVMPFLSGNDMAISLGAASCFHETKARFYVAELLIAIEELQAHHVLHRDIKLSNIGLTPDGHVQLLDFGYATTLQPSELEFAVEPSAASGSFSLPDPDYTSTERVGTLPYMSADQHLGRPYSWEADLHALGVTLFRMLTGRFPFGDGVDTPEGMLEAVVCEQIIFQADDKVSAEARDLLGLLLRRDSKRPALLSEALAHPFFDGVQWDRIRARKASPPWKPFIGPLPKKVTEGLVISGSPCSPDIYPDFTYISSDLKAQRAHASSGILWSIASMFKKPDSPPVASTQPPSPTTRLVFSTPPPKLSSPPPSAPPSLPLPPLPTARRTSSPPTSMSLTCGPLPRTVRAGLQQRRPSPKSRPIRADISRMPGLIVTPAEDEVGAEVDAVSPALRAPLLDLTNQQRLLSPEDAERPSWNPVVSSAPRIKLAPPPKRRRAQKENEDPQAPATKMRSNAKPRALSTTPKNAPAPVRVSKVKPPAVVPKPQTQPKRSSLALATPPAINTPKVKPAFKVPVKVSRRASSATPPSVKIKTPRATVPNSPVSPSPAGFASVARVVASVDQLGSLKTAAQFEAYIGAAEVFASPLGKFDLKVMESVTAVPPPAPKALTVPPPVVSLDTKADFSDSSTCLVPEASPEGYKHDLKRLWIRFTMAVDRVLARLQTWMILGTARL
ncbi:hypothetical protein DXG01_016880 [Tephrocybe rancida]|nr:hypothetical protein DXG01_016880 [Tephrocybe rancida]